MALTLDHYKKHYSEYADGIINAVIIEDSIYPTVNGKRATTLLLTLPQIIHPELLRHRAFSFSVSSNRAVPSKRVKVNTKFQPVWRLANTGMQPSGFMDVSDNRYDVLYVAWKRLQESAVNFADKHSSYVAKELVNRPMAPFQIINVLVTATEFDNFFTLRKHSDAQFEIQVLADRMFNAIEDSNPRPLKLGEWHIPFVSFDERNTYSLAQTLLISAARCARTSYLLPDTACRSTPSDDLMLCKKLLEPPIHASPFEHVLTPRTFKQLYGVELPGTVGSQWWGNTRGYLQLRSLLEAKILPATLNEFDYLLGELKDYGKRDYKQGGYR